jgi:hypothetical protein
VPRLGRGAACWMCRRPLRSQRDVYDEVRIPTDRGAQTLSAKMALPKCVIHNMVDACLATYLILLARSCRTTSGSPTSSCRSGSGRHGSRPSGGGRQSDSRQQGPNTGHYRRAGGPHGPAKRKLASVGADLKESTQAREQHAPRKATCDFEAALP